MQVRFLLGGQKRFGYLIGYNSTQFLGSIYFKSMHFLNPVAILGVCGLIVFGAFIFPIPDQILSQVAQTAGGPTFSFSPDSYSVEEGKNITLKVKANGPIYQTTRVKIQAQSGTASVRSDFNPLVTTVTFYRGGLSTKSVTFKTKKDSFAEGEETATVKIISINGISTSQAATVTISDVGTTGGNAAAITCAINEPCDKFDPWRPFASRQVGGVVYEVKTAPTFGSGGNSTGTFTTRQAIHPKIGSVSISGKIVEPWAYSPSMFAAGNTRNIGIPGNNIAIFALIMPTNSPDYPTKTWTLEYINDTPTNSGAGSGIATHVISKIPGDFNPNNVPEGCRQSASYGGGSFILSMDPTARQATNSQTSLRDICYLVPGQKYYYNVVYAVIDYSDVDAETKRQISQWNPVRPPTTPMTYEASGKTARIVDTATCFSDNGSGPVFTPLCDQRWVFRALDGGNTYITIGSQENDPTSKCNEFAPQHPGKKVYVTTNTTNTSLSKLYRCDNPGTTLIPWLDQNY